MVTLMAPVGFSGGGGGHLIWFIFFFFPPAFLFSFPRDRKMTVTNDKLVRCLVGDVL